MYPDAERLLQLIAEGNPFQARYIDKMKREVMGRREYDILEILIQFFSQQGIPVEKQAEAYLNFIQETMAEQLYFRRNHCYRTNDYDKVCQATYMNNAYMSNYVIALSLTGCVWSNHIYTLRWYEEELKTVCANRADNYLEIGCGLGINLLRTMQMTNAAQYYSIDLSEKAVELCKALLVYADECGILDGKNYVVKCADFFEPQILDEGRADIFTMFEVLEHVPNPDEMLERIKKMTTEYAQIFVSTAINSPMPDHIYLFRSVQDVVDMVESHGFMIENKICAAANNIDLETAVQKELPITIALRLRKKATCM